MCQRLKADNIFVSRIYNAESAGICLIENNRSKRIMQNSNH